MQTMVGHEFSDQIHKQIGSLVASAQDLTFGPPPAFHGPPGDGLSSFIANRFQVLAEALRVDEPEIFTTDLFWAKGYLTSRDFPKAIFEKLVFSIKKVVTDLSPFGPGGALAPYFSIVGPLDLDHHMEPHEGIAANPGAASFLKLLLEGNRKGARDLVFKYLHEGLGIKEIYLNIFQASQREIGRLWYLNHITVGQEHYVTGATQSILAELYPQVFAGKKNGRSVVVACSPGETHELGSRMVADFFEMSGWNSIYLGSDSPAADVVGMALQEGASFVALSVSTPLQIGNMLEVVNRCHGQKSKIPIMVGGKLFHRHPNLVRKSGADLFADDAERAVLAAGIYL